MIIETTAHRLIQRQVNALQSMLSEKDKIAYDSWFGDQSYDLELEDKDIERDLDKWSLALYEIKSLEKDSDRLERLEDGLKNFKKLLSEDYE